VSVTRKIVEGARSGLNSLIDKVLADETPLTGIERDELDAELERRTQARAGGARPPAENPRARWAGAGEEAAKKRREAAEVRERRIRQVRAAKRKAEEAAQEQAWQKFQGEARRQGGAGAGDGGAGARRAASGARSGGSSAGSAGGRRPGGFGPRNDKIAKYYKVLDLPYGADFEQVKASYRKLMRKYHPDLHTQSPQKAKAATELSMQVTQAYNELETHLIGGSNRKA
jgi:DnaJ domain